jgi:flagellar hook protein FlgE
MGLTSSLSTALTGMNAAETQIDVLGNNLANSQTVGYKASEVVFATQFLQTLSLGASPTSDNGGTNPRQSGLGVQVAGINQSFRQGTIEISSNPSDLAIQGDGFFQVQGGQGETLYTRNGIFRLNASNELVTSTGNRLLGYSIDDQFNIQTSTTVPLTVPLGTEAVAKATTSVTMQGTLSAQGDIGNVSEIIQSSILGDSSIPRPSASALSLTSSSTPTSTGVSVGHTQASGGSHAEGAVYSYRLVYVDSAGKESLASDPISVTVPAGNGLADNTITLNNLPAASTQYSQLRVYRTTNGGNNHFLLGTAAAGGSFTDSNTTPLSTTALDNNALNGNYSYMITYFKNGEGESRPSPLAGPINIVNGRTVLTNFPTPPTPPTGGGFPAYDQIRIYRNLSNDPNSFYLVDTVAPGATYTDGKTDAQIANLTVTGNKKVDLEGPTINSNTLLVNVIKRDGFDYLSPFKEGTLSFKARKGGRVTPDAEFEVTNSTTVQDLLSFIQDTTGIQTDSGDASNPIVASQNNIAGETGTVFPGVYISNGRIRVVANTGVDNAIDIDLTSFRLKDSNGAITTPSLSFGEIQNAVGRSATADFVTYDSLGLPLRVRMTAVLESRDDNSTTYRWYADSGDTNSRTNNSISVGTGLVRFDGNGNFVSSTNSTIAIERDGLPSDKPLEFDIDFSNVSGLAAEASSLAAARQDGSPPGVLTSYVIGEDGTIRGVFSNGVSRDLGLIRLARFTNNNGLEQRGQNLFAQGINTGLPIEGRPGESGLGTVSSGALELSNTDVGGDLVNLVLASTQYRSNARVITATQQLFDELLNLRR